MKNFERKCPKCSRKIKYKKQCYLNRAVMNNTLCKRCSKSGKNNPMYGKKCPEHSKRMSGNNNPCFGRTDERHPLYNKKRPEHSKRMKNNNPAKQPEVRKRMSESHKGKKRPEHSKQMSGKNNPMYGKSYYEVWIEKYGKEEADKKQKETNLKRRVSAIERMKNTNGQISPNYNPKAIPIIRARAKELGITDLQDAETSDGEFQVCGYFVDGRSKKRNIVIEYNEKHHKYRTERDERRKQEIIKELGCEFIEIKEW